MNNDHLMTPLKDLNLTNRFLFDQVMEDTGTLEDVLSIILEKDIHLLFPGQTEKEQRISPLAKSVRMDVLCRSSLISSAPQFSPIASNPRLFG